ncbi:glucuronate isomerase [Microbacterium sp. zg.Y1090]|uniref:glucuronate isomerase n=1 Tax=Microbacterium TaxID=33882 RepID=UPI00214B06E7|nr:MULTISPECIES: glucuronate isomerase [unclassified Microbacterium]MCR2813812.1 glucuronate isomerase [Microbacterium sp. zg.Y1084]MCR2819674.1 glucuronate isomerase [Microbacterium sp. zg.Y1090]WIM28082.1 glucuronate isomerase [Microbacterium sp. zg-Y1090]
MTVTSTIGVDQRPWTLHADRALPAEPEVRAVARRILGETSALPIVSMHGHVDAALLADDEAFPDPARLLVTPDHYLVRMLVSQATSPGPVRDAGVRSVADLGVGDDGERDPRVIWRRFCAGWSALRGTPTRFWLEHVLAEVFHAPASPSPETADALFDHLADRLAEPAFRPRALFERFGIELLATTDSAVSTLDAHRRLGEQGWGERVIPTFRPDPLFEIARPGWPALLDELSAVSGIDAHDYDGFLLALRERRRAFIRAGARASDHGHLRADTTPLPAAEARILFDVARRGHSDPAAAAAFTAHMLFQTAEMAADDGLVMQLHPGVVRDHDRGVAARYGSDIGYDIPVATEFTRALRPLLEAFGHHPGFRMIVFTVDETVYSRELAPLAGVYPALRLGAPWWFLDTPDAIRRFREATTDTAGLRNTSGFVDDTRAFCSIPARHDLSRRADAGFLARLVAEHRLEFDEALETAVDLAYRLPQESYPRPAAVSA